MARPLGVSIVAALFMAQAVVTLAWMVQRLRTMPAVVIAWVVAGAAIQALAAVGLLRMRKWGRSLALVICGLMFAVGLLMRARGAAPEAVLPMLFTAGTVIVYLVSSPARLHFT